MRLDLGKQLPHPGSYAPIPSEDIYPMTMMESLVGKARSASCVLKSSRPLVLRPVQGCLGGWISCTPEGWLFTRNAGKLWHLKGMCLQQRKHMEKGPAWARGLSPISVFLCASLQMLS